MAALAGAAALVVAAPTTGMAVAYSLQPDLSLGESYDDNVDRVTESRRDDWITTIGTGLTASAITARSRASLRYGLGVQFFANDTQEQGQLTHDGSLAATYQATRRLTLRAADSVRLSEDQVTAAAQAVPGPARDPGLELPEPPPAVDPASIPTRRVRRLDNAATAGASYAYDPWTAFGLAYSFQVTRFEGSSFAETDSHTGSVDASRQMGRNDRLGLAYSAEWSRPREADREERWFHDARVSWAHSFSDELSASASLGVSWSDQGDVELGPVGDATFGRRRGPTRYAARYSAGYRTSEIDAAATRFDQASVGIAHELSRSVTATAGAAYGRTEPLETAEGITHSFSATAGFAVALTRWLSLTTDYAYQRNDAPPGLQSFYNNRVSLGLRLLLPAWRSRPF